jgi:hypothetical protein
MSVLPRFSFVTRQVFPREMSKPQPKLGKSKSKTDLSTKPPLPANVKSGSSKIVTAKAPARQVSKPSVVPGRSKPKVPVPVQKEKAVDIQTNNAPESPKYAEVEPENSHPIDIVTEPSATEDVPQIVTERTPLLDNIESNVPVVRPKIWISKGCIICSAIGGLFAMCFLILWITLYASYIPLKIQSAFDRDDGSTRLKMMELGALGVDGFPVNMDIEIAKVDTFGFNVDVELTQVYVGISGVPLYEIDNSTSKTVSGVLFSTGLVPLSFSPGAVSSNHPVRSLNVEIADVPFLIYTASQAMKYGLLGCTVWLESSAIVRIPWLGSWPAKLDRKYVVPHKPGPDSIKNFNFTTSDVVVKSVDKEEGTQYNVSLKLAFNNPSPIALVSGATISFTAFSQNVPILDITVSIDSLDPIRNDIPGRNLAKVNIVSYSRYTLELMDAVGIYASGEAQSIKVGKISVYGSLQWVNDMLDTSVIEFDIPGATEEDDIGFLKHIMNRIKH